MKTHRYLPRRRLLAACLALLAAPAWAGDTVIHAGRLIDGTGAAPRERVSIVIRDQRIAAIQDGYVDLPGAQLIELPDGTVLPGLIDAHLHITSSSMDPPQRTTAAATALQAAENARLTLLAGVTSVRDVAAADVTVVVALKRAIAKGLVPGPRLWVSGQALGPTGGHMDPSNGMAPDWADRPGDWKNGVVDGPESAARAVRWMHQQGADLIKIAPSGGVASEGDDPNAQLMSEAEIKAVVDTAHALGMKVAAHAHGKQAIESAVRLGVDSIEHGTFADAQTYALMKQHGTFLLGTQTIGHDIYAIAEAHPEKLPPGSAQKAIAVIPVLDHNVAAAYKAGVKLGAGSDNFGGLAPFGSDTREFQYMVENAGVKPMDAIVIGTRNNAELIGAAADIGTLQPGRYADVIAVPGDPLQDIRQLQRVDFVMKGGKVYKRDGKPVQ
ncbi:MAG: amidohydrolase family protein [Pseudomonas sp.]